MNSWKPDGVYTSPWLHRDATPFIREAIRFRRRLIPYLYSLMHEAVTHGTPPLQPLFTWFEDDPLAFEDGDAFMLGPFLLGCPVTAPGVREVTPYLPNGPECWFDFWSEECLPAGSVARMAAPLDRLPLAVPAGAILPLADTSSATNDAATARYSCIFPGPDRGASRFDLWEDDGITPASPHTKLSLELAWTPELIHLSAAGTGHFSLPYKTLTVVLPKSERRPIQLTSLPGAPLLAVGSYGNAAHA
jgi:alpha-glucosidase